MVRGEDAETLADLARLADGYKAALAEVRPMGGALRLHEKSSKPRAERLQEATEIFPARLDRAVERGRVTAVGRDRRPARVLPRRVLRRVTRAGRRDVVPGPERHRETPTDGIETAYKRNRLDSMYAVYEPVDDAGGRTHRGGLSRPPGPGGLPAHRARLHPRAAGLARAGEGRLDESGRFNDTGEGLWIKPRMSSKTVRGGAVSELRLSKAPTACMPGMGPQVPVAMHALTHRFQYTIPTLSTMEHAFRRRRATAKGGGLERTVRLASGRDEFAFKDEFVTAYSGRDYGRWATEITTVGVQALFGGHYGGFLAGQTNTTAAARDHDDPSYWGLVLGALASAGRCTE